MECLHQYCILYFKALKTTIQVTPTIMSVSIAVTSIAGKQSQ